ncbi:MAG: Ribosome biogenesis protein, partial [Marteilia pararefringens]
VQNNYIERSKALSGQRPDLIEYTRKREQRKIRKASYASKKLRHNKAKIFHERQRVNKIEISKTIKAHEEKRIKNPNKSDDDKLPKGAIPPYLMDRNKTRDAKVLSNTIKQKRKEKGGKWSVPIEKVQETSEAEAFSVVKTGKRQKKTWKRMVNKVTFVEPDFTRKPPKCERFIRPMAMRFTKAHVSHPELKTTFQLPLLSVHKNPSSKLMTSLGVITKGTIIEVNVSELGMVTENGKIVWGKYAQVTNKPELDGCINAVLLT